MQRRAFLASVTTAGLAGIAGCMGDTDHLEEYKANLDERGVDVIGAEPQSDEVVTAEISTSNSMQDIAAAALAYVDQVDAGWEVTMIEGIAREEMTLGWHVRAEWAHDLLADEIGPDEFGDLLNDTIEPVLVVGGEEEESMPADE